jgi:16S rRNA (adenine1518-N6/adenine1519-N6)-dimethyltransferase
MIPPRNQLAAWNLRAKKRFGQHFLNDPSTAETILDCAGLDKQDVALEVGPGLGALTFPLAKRVRRVYAVEKDSEIFQRLRKQLAVFGIDNVVLIHQDILRFDISVLARQEQMPLVVLGNLPYNISSQVLVRLIACRENVRWAVFMFQKELALRLLASPGSKSYGRLSVMLRHCGRAEKLMDVGAFLFFPRPKVNSELLKITFFDRSHAGSDDERHLFAVIKAAFGRRRKTLKNALCNSFLNVSEREVVTALNAAGVDPMRRAETLTAAEFEELSRRLKTTAAHRV